MEQTLKHFKISSFAVLILAGFSLFEIISELLFGELNSAQLPAGAPENTLLIAKIVLLAVSVLLLLPKFYVGIKGLRIAKNPNTSKRHITWAMIIFAVLLLELIGPAVTAIQQGGGYDNISAVCGVLMELAFYYDYIKYAKAVAKQAE